MDRQGQPKKIQTLVIVLILAATLASPLMIVSNVFDISLAYATAAAGTQDAKFDKASLRNELLNEQPDCALFCSNYQNHTG
jgi:hypothetical protein